MEREKGYVIEIVKRAASKNNLVFANLTMKTLDNSIQVIDTPNEVRIVCRSGDVSRLFGFRRDCTSLFDSAQMLYFCQSDARLLTITLSKSDNGFECPQEDESFSICSEESECSLNTTSIST